MYLTPHADTIKRFAVLFNITFVTLGVQVWPQTEVTHITPITRTRRREGKVIILQCESEDNVGEQVLER